MALPPGNYNAQHALNDFAPITRRVKLGDMLNTIVNAINALAVQADVGMAIDAGATFASGTLTVAGTQTAGNSFTTTFTNASLPAFVSGVTVGPVNIVAGDTATTVAAKLVLAINGNLALTNAGVVATNSAGVVTVKAPGTVGASFVLTSTLSAGASVTVTASNPSGGGGAVVSRNAAMFPLTPLNQL